MVKVTVQTEKHKRYYIILPTFLLSTFINFAFSKRLWKFIHNRTKEQTAVAIYRNASDIKFLLKMLSKELKYTSLSEPLVDICLKDGTYVKVTIT
ncbi:hypothetical protein KGR20_01000 [Cytobacillus oceanisediminis]|uniref:hypothetical protein n=1 Tax=Bacillaceae TaxID=186817 RepID=UPI0003328DC5|nr:MULTISPECIES: hypothetical protein [Bacillaceae]EOR23233.1 hypothetical protein A499_13776 [Niallia nealsonii AAU1]MBZ9532834.1 hypothetical protein [Cytobacillus oceanisediminis]MED3793275.1 hypothetical protein [Niallia alba]UTI42915.1 hypothetical protein NKG37_04025 [Niallia sp. RD1]